MLKKTITFSSLILSTLTTSSFAEKEGSFLDKFWHQSKNQESATVAKEIPSYK